MGNRHISVIIYMGDVRTGEQLLYTVKLRRHGVDTVLLRATTFEEAAACAQRAIKDYNAGGFCIDAPDWVIKKLAPHPTLGGKPPVVVWVNPAVPPRPPR